MGLKKTVNEIQLYYVFGGKKMKGIILGEERRSY